MIEIKDATGQTLLSTPINTGAKGYYSLMQHDYITLPLKLKEPIDFKIGSYADLRGVFDDALGGKLAKIYYVTEKQNPTYNTSTGAYEYNLRLDAYYWLWNNFIFKYTPEDTAGEASWSLTAPLDVQLGVFLRNLSALGFKYNGTTAYEYSIDSTVENKAVAMTYNNMKLLDALFSMAGEDKWNCDCWITENVIHFGRNEFGDAVKIERDVEASAITRSESKGTYATRIYAFGSTRNIPANYRETSNPDLTVNGIVQKRLMLPEDIPYIDAYEDMQPTEVVECVMTNDAIYPRRTGTLSSVTAVDRAIEDEEGTQTGTFKAYQYKDTGLTFDESYIIEGQELRIVFQSGKLNGLDFGVIFNPNGSDPAEQLWEIVANEDYGRRLPDEVMKPEDGDEYILYGFDIELVSDQYIPAAEEELKQWAQAKADRMKADDGTYTATLRASYVKANLISRTYDVGQKVNLMDPAFFGTTGRASRVIGWEMNLDIPYDAPTYTIGETSPYSRLEEIEDKVESLVFNGQTYQGTGGGSGVYIIKVNDSTAPSDSNVFSALRSLMMFLRKDKSDYTNYLVKFLGGLISDNIQSQDFTTGALGAGFCLKKDDNGDSYLEVDRALFRKTATFIELLIQKLRHVGGQIILSPASMSCAKVEEHDTFYRCYFETTDGDKTIGQEFVTGDQARCQTFNIREGVSENVSNTYYWRLVVGTGDNYIDLSKTDCDAGSTVPHTGDDIVLLGNRTDVTRQGAVVLSAYGNDAPYIKMYRGINSYNMSGKEFFVASRKELMLIADRILMSATGKDVETSISDAQLLATALSKGIMLFDNPTFKKLTGQLSNKIDAYNDATVRTFDDDTIANDSGTGLRVTLASNGRNGFYWNVPGGANVEYIAYFVAKLPVGFIAIHNAQAASELNARWLTTNKGTGQWEEYACHIKYNAVPKYDVANNRFGRCCYFSFTGTAEYPVDILLRYATVYKLNSHTLYATDEKVQSLFEITNDKIESQVESTRIGTVNDFLKLNESAMVQKYPSFNYSKQWRNGMSLYCNTGGLSWRFITNNPSHVDTYGAVLDYSGKYYGTNQLAWEVTEVVKPLSPGESRRIIFTHASKPNKMVVIKIIAWIPAGYELNAVAYNIGTKEASQGWLTPKDGTGGYKEYIYYVRYGNDAPENANNYVGIRLYRDGGGNGETVKWYIGWAALYNLTNATQDDLNNKYNYLRTNIQQTDAKIESTAERISYNLSMLGTSDMLNDDPTFRSGYGGLQPFNGSYGGVTLSRLQQASPNSSGYVLNMHHGSSDHFNFYAGIRWDIQSAAYKKYVFRLTAKIPFGWELKAHATAVGGGEQGWFDGTDLSGDGLWHDYFYLIKCGGGGTFDPVGRFGIVPKSGTSVPPDGIDWQLCFAAAYNLTDENFRTRTLTSISQTAQNIALTARRVGEAEAQIKVQADEINLKVGKDEYNGKEIKSLINMSNNGIRIQADQLDLIGAITISMLGSGLLATINNIKEKANAAVPVDDFDNMLEDAVVNGKTLIAGGFINTELINVMNLVAHKIEAATGSFYSLTCINESNVGVGKITFNSNGQLTFEGDILHQGTPSGTTRGYRFLANTVWCRGAFGARYRTTAYIAGNISTITPYIYIYERETLIYNAQLSSGTDSSGNTYYVIPGVMTSGAASGMPVDTIAFSLFYNLTYRFKLDLETHQRVTLVNLNDDDNGRINLYSNGRLVTLAGGCGLSAQKFVTNMMNPVNSNLGAGILFTAGQYDNNWK